MQSFEPNTEGVFPGLSFDDYKAAPGISQSLLKAFAAEPTPKHYRESLTRPKKVTEAMEFGTILHAAILTPDLLSTAYHLRPETRTITDEPWDGRSGWCKDWVKAHRDRPVITLKEEADVMSIASTVLSLPVAGDIIRTGQKEVSFFKKDEETGLLLKCRVDAIASDTNGETFICDLKKVRRGYASPERFGIQCADLGYDYQCASYLWITGASRFLFVAMEESAPFEAMVYELDPGDIAEGLSKYRKALHSYAEAVANGTWPGYDRTVKRLRLPAWSRSKEQREVETLYE